MSASAGLRTLGAKKARVESDQSRPSQGGRRRREEADAEAAAAAAAAAASLDCSLWLPISGCRGR